MRRMASQELRKLGEQVDAWRKQQSKRTQIPEELWDTAVEVTRIDGVWATARATRFNYKKLSERVALARQRERGERRALTVVDRADGDGKAPTVGPRFVELPVGALGALGGMDRTVVEVVGRYGDRMRVEVPVGAMDVAGVIQAFWSRQP